MYVIFLVSYGALLLTTLFIAFKRGRSNLDLLVPRLRRASLWRFIGLVSVLLFFLVQIGRYPHPGVAWGALWLPLILAALFLNYALLSTSPALVALLLRLERLFASGLMSRLLAFVLSFIICLVCLEFVLRLWQPTFVGASFYRKDPEVGFLMRGDTPGTNSLGFRDKEHPFEKPDGVYRIVALGDSFAFGSVPYDENYLTLLEGLLGEQLGRRVEVINLGVPAYAPKEELRLLEKFGLGYDPDHIMVNFFAGNDLTDNKPTFKDKILLNGVPFNVHTFPRGVLLFQYWYLHHYLKVGFVAHRLSERGEAPAPGREPPSKSSPDSSPETGPISDISRKKFNQGLALYAALFLRSSEDLLRERFDYASSFLLEMKDLAERSGAAFSIAVLPEQMQVDRKIRKQVMRENGLRASDYDFETPSRLFEAFGLDHNIPILDLLPYFKEGCETEKLYIELDSHWNKRGNRLAAEAIADLWK